MVAATFPLANINFFERRRKEVADRVELISDSSIRSHYWAKLQEIASAIYRDSKPCGVRLTLTRLTDLRLLRDEIELRLAHQRETMQRDPIPNEGW